jgi:hypothetical protein
MQVQAGRPRLVEEVDPPLISSCRPLRRRMNDLGDRVRALPSSRRVCPPDGERPPTACWGGRKNLEINLLDRHEGVAPRSTLRRDAMPLQSAPVTPQEAERVWKSQARPSARSVARALTYAGRPVHFTTVARWERQGLLTIARSSEPLAGITTKSAELPSIRSGRLHFTA